MESRSLLIASSRWAPTSAGAYQAVSAHAFATRWQRHPPEGGERRAQLTAKCPLPLQNRPSSRSIGERSGEPPPEALKAFNQSDLAAMVSAKTQRGGMPSFPHCPPTRFLHTMHPSCHLPISLCHRDLFGRQAKWCCRTDRLYSCSRRSALRSASARSNSTFVPNSRISAAASSTASR
jgi:hypothetical protein